MEKKTNSLHLAWHPVISALARGERGPFLSLALSSKLCNAFLVRTKICIAQVTIFTICVPASRSSQHLPASAGVANYLLAMFLALSSCLSDLSSRAGALPALSGFLWVQHTAVSQPAQLLCTRRKWKNELAVKYCHRENNLLHCSYKQLNSSDHWRQNTIFPPAEGEGSSLAENNSNSQIR